MKKKGNTVSADSYKPVEDRKQGFDEWEVRDALQVLSKARKIQRNKPLMAAVRKAAKQQLADLQAVSDTISKGAK